LSLLETGDWVEDCLNVVISVLKKENLLVPEPSGGTPTETDIA
jgi:hypothetical protein